MVINIISKKCLRGIKYASDLTDKILPMVTWGRHSIISVCMAGQKILSHDISSIFTLLLPAFLAFYPHVNLNYLTSPEVLLWARHCGRHVEMGKWDGVRGSGRRNLQYSLHPTLWTWVPVTDEHREAMSSFALPFPDLQNGCDFSA